MKNKENTFLQLNKANYNAIYLKVAKQTKMLNTDYDCFVLLNKLLLSINDNHSKIYGIDKGADRRK